MAYTWGSTTLKVAKNSYAPLFANNGIVEINILPDSSGNAASILQQGGRNRKRISLSGYGTEAEYYALLTDYYAATSRVFTDTDGNTLTSVIEALSATREDNGLYPYVYSITLVEA